MDRETLDRLYNNRAAVPTHPQDMERWAASSAATRQRLACRLDLSYGAHPREVFDLFTVPQPDRPLLVFIHGGYWQALDKASFSFIANGFAAEAASQIANVAVISYPLAPEADMDRIVASMRHALVWLWREAAPLGFDRDRICVAGHSAGGHLAAMAGLTDWAALDGAVPADLVKSVLSVSGLYDLLPIRRSYLNDRLGLTEMVAIRNSPQMILPQWRGRLAPMVCVVGGEESAAYHGQQHDFVTAYAERGGRVTAVTAPDRHHFNIPDELARPGSEIQAAFMGTLQ